MKSLKNLKINHKYVFFSLSIIVLFFVIAYFVAVDSKIEQYLEKNDILPLPFEISRSEYPVLATNQDPGITAQAAVVIDNESKTLLFSKNSDLLFSMASTTKIMTALVALSHYDMDDVLTVQSDNIDGVTIGLWRGQKIKFEDLIYAMLLPSANDAAQAIADNYPGGAEKFVEEMNRRAVSMNLYNTHFADPIGLLDERDYTTPHDLARLASIALENEDFSKIVSTKTKLITDLDGTLNSSVSNLNELLGIDGVNGVKTGYTDGAGQVLVASKNQGDRILISVVMSSKDRFSDTQKLFDFVGKNINYLSIHP